MGKFAVYRVYILEHVPLGLNEEEKIQDYVICRQIVGNEDNGKKEKKKKKQQCYT